MNRILSLFVAVIITISYCQAAQHIIPVDTTKAVKMAKKAEKLLAKGTPESIGKSIGLYEQAADMGLLSAQRVMVSFYENSDIRPLPIKVLKWEENLAINGDVYCQYIVGSAYIGLDNGAHEVDVDYSKGLRYIKMAADNGDIISMVIYGVSLFDGEYEQEKNEAEGFRYLKKAADGGNEYAQNRLGIMYYWGQYVSVDYKKSFEYTKLSAEQEYPEAMFNLGHSYHLGEGVEKNLDEAIYWYSKASDLGDEGAKNNLALALEEKNGNSDETLTLLRKSADAGDEVGQYNLGTRYEAGNGVTQDYGMAFALYKKSADKGYAPSQRRLGIMYTQGIGTEKDGSKAFEYSMLAADQNDTTAINNVGYLYQEGIGTEKNPRLAFAYYKKAADMGCLQAMLGLVGCYYNGFGVEQSKQKAFEYAKKVADGGMPKACSAVADSYLQGDGTSIDYNKALHYYQKALDLGVEDESGVLFSMSLCYKELHNTQKYVEYTRKAADKNQPRAMYNLALCYYNGTGVKKDLAKAKSLLQKCASQTTDTEVRNSAKEALQSM